MNWFGSIADIAKRSSLGGVLVSTVLEHGGQGGSGFVFLVKGFAGSEREGAVLVAADANSLGLKANFMLA